jgi:phosphatidylglycerophosphatase A
MNTSPETPRRPTLRFVLANPAHFIAFGFGVGLFPLGPGTLGTVLAFPIYYALAAILPGEALLACIVAAMLIAGSAR